jgi:hypothetical protein
MGETPALLLLGLVILLIFAAIGVFVGTLVYFQRGRSKKQAEQRPAASPPEPVLEPGEPVTRPEDAKSSPEPPTELPAHPGEVMRVIRDEQTGRVVVQVEGQQYTSLREIHDARVGRRVLWAIADLIRFTGGMAANPQAVRSVAQDQEPPLTRSVTPSLQGDTSPEPSPSLSGSTQQPPSGEAPALESMTQPVSDEAGPSLTPEDEEWRQARQISATAQPPEEDSGRTGVVEFFRRGFDRSEPTSPVSGPSSFIDEIEEILQARIRRRSEPLPYGVHVKAAEAGGLEIQVGLDTYSSPDEVPDHEIRDLIKASVAEWEQQ